MFHETEKNAATGTLCWTDASRVIVLVPLFATEPAGVRLGGCTP